MREFYSIALCIVLSMHIHRIAAEDIPEAVQDTTANPIVIDRRVILEDMQYEQDSDGDSQVPQLLLPRGKENEYVRLPDKDGEFDVVSRTLVEQGLLEGTVYDAQQYTRFILHTRANNGTPAEFKYEEIDQLPKRYGFKPEAPTKILIHGWLGNSHSAVIDPLAEAFLETGDFNVIAVNWEKGAKTWFYPTARYRVPKVAELVSGVIGKLFDLGQTPEQIGLIGHSLGAHIAGLAGKNAKRQIAFIFGLDPASPLFRYNKEEDRLAANDAQYVEVIHTNAKALGFYRNIGQVDFYPNGGVMQPGCGLSLTCSHERSALYFRESLKVQDLFAHRCSDVDALDNKCSLGDTFLGGLDLNRLKSKARGVYYLTTDSRQPFLKFVS